MKRLLLFLIFVVNLHIVCNTQLFELQIGTLLYAQHMTYEAQDRECKGDSNPEPDTNFGEKYWSSIPCEYEIIVWAANKVAEQISNGNFTIARSVVLECISKYGDCFAGDAAAKYIEVEKLIKEGILREAASGAFKSKLVGILKFNTALTLLNGALTLYEWDSSKDSSWVSGAGVILGAISICITFPEFATGSAAVAIVGTGCAIGSHLCTWYSMCLTAKGN